ncbi:MAG: hypothetical protein HYS86_05445 [Candidatus Chisholmbacteria bacterium]|nr:hypothetical protein [Candidatus Chisholmbacteria bacterium]
MTYYEGLKDTAHENLSHFVSSRLDNTIYVGIKMKPDTFVGIVSQRGILLKRMAPQTLSFFKNAGSLVDLLPQAPNGPARELVQYLKDTSSVRVFDHDQINSNIFRDWHTTHPEAERVFYNSLAEVWQPQN